MRLPRRPRRPSSTEVVGGAAGASRAKAASKASTASVLLVLAAGTLPAALSLSRSLGANAGGRHARACGRVAAGAASAGAAIATPRLSPRRCRGWSASKGAAPGDQHPSVSSSSSSSLNWPTATSLRMALGGNYLDDIGANEADGDSSDADRNRRGGGGGGGNNNDNGEEGNFRNGGNRWGFFGGGGSATTGGGRGRSGGGAGTGTAVRPSPAAARNRGGGDDGDRGGNRDHDDDDDQGNVDYAGGSRGDNYGVGGGGGRDRRSGGGGGGATGAGVPKVFSIGQPQDLLDFVIQDERLSVVKVYASWCKTCKVFDTRYRKLAAQLGDSADASGATRPGRARFAEMRFDDPNNEEMCRLLNATKLPYILMYKGSRGKVADFQCGPAKFQSLVDAVDEFVNLDGSAQLGKSSPVEGAGEQEWRVAGARQQRRVQQEEEERRRAAQFGPAGSIVDYPPVADDDRLQRKENEISRLYAELSNLRKDFDRRIVQLKESHSKETSELEERVQEQTRQYDAERRALSAQIEKLSRELMEREKAYRSDETAAERRFGDRTKAKEEEYKETLTGLNLRITELETDLFKSRNELQRRSDTSSGETQRLNGRVADLERELSALRSRNEDLERDLIEEKRVVVASTEEAARVLKQLEKIKGSEDEERKRLASRVAELEGEIANREWQATVSNSQDGDMAREIQQELDRLKDEYKRERQVMADRIAELERELAWQQSSSSSNEEKSSSLQQQLKEQREESSRLSDRILELENDIDERDRLLRTSNKAADILLDNMESMKSEYEEELERTASLVNELEEAIASREEELGVLRERFESLERMAGELKQREEERQEEAATASNAGGSGIGRDGGTFQFADAMRMSQRADEEQDIRWRAEQEARMAAERQVSELEGRLRDREAEIAQMQDQGSDEKAPQMFNFGALFGGAGFGVGAGAGAEPSAEGSGAGWGWDTSGGEESMDNYEMLKDVLMPDEISPRGGYGASEFEGGAPGGGGFEGAGMGWGRTENIWEGAGGAGRSENVRDGAGTYATPSPSGAGANGPAPLPTPAMAFERRLAENPIVPAGAFGGSKPTASFFGQSMSTPEPPSESPGYYRNVIENFHNENVPAMPPMASFEQRPTAPAPRAPARGGMTENIYAGAGSVSSATPSPSVQRREEPAAPLPTPAMAFERRIAENPIVPAGTFGGSRPTAHFFGPKPTPQADSQPQATFRDGEEEDDDPRSKWQRLDDAEKKRVAAEAYRAFERSLEDGRKSSTPRGGSPGREGKARVAPSSTGGSGVGDDGGGSSAATGAPKQMVTSNSESNQLEVERKKHRDMVKAAATTPAPAADAAKEKKNATTPPSKAEATDDNSSALQQSQQLQQKQTAQQIQASAVQASAKRMSLAERAAKADLDRKEREKRLKAEARKARDARRMEDQRRTKDANRANEEVKRAEEAAKREAIEAERKAEEARREAEQAKLQAEEARKKEEIRRAEELKRKADADLALAKQTLDLERKLMTKASEEEQTRAKEQKDEGGRVEQANRMETHRRIEAALLGAEEDLFNANNEIPDDSSMQEEQVYLAQASGDQTTSPMPTKGKAPQQKSSTGVATSGSGFSVSKSYDVVVLKNQQNDVEMPRLLKGSLKELLRNDQPPRGRRRKASGDTNY